MKTEGRERGRKENGRDKYRQGSEEETKRTGGDRWRQK